MHFCSSPVLGNVTENEQHCDLGANNALTCTLASVFIHVTMQKKTKTEIQRVHASSSLSINHSPWQHGRLLIAIRQSERAKKWWRRGEEDLLCRCFQGSAALQVVLLLLSVSFFLSFALQLEARKHFSSIKATLLYKPLTQYLEQRTENSSSFTDTIREHFWLEISKESQRIKARFN